MITLVRANLNSYASSKHSHKNRKDSQKGSLNLLLFATQLRFPKILVPRSPQNLSDLRLGPRIFYLSFLVHFELSIYLQKATLHQGSYFFSDVILVSNYRGCKGEAIKLVQYYMTDIIYKSVKASHLEKLLSHTKHKRDVPSHDCIVLLCHVRASELIHTLQLPECQETPCSKQSRNLTFNV